MPPTTPAPAAPDAGWRQFRRYWIGHLASFTGDWFTMLALPLAALAVGGSALFVGVVEFAELAATLTVGMRLGLLADRTSPRATMIAADLARATLVGLLAVAFAIDAPPRVALVLVAFLMGSMRDLHDASESVMVTAVVPEHLLVRANGRFQVSDGLGHMVGSLLAGAAASISVAVAFGVDAVSYVLAALAVVAMGRFAVVRDHGDPDVVEHPAGAADRRSAWSEVWRSARDDDRYWRVLATMCVTNVATVCFMGQFVTFGTEVLHLAEWQIGLTLSAMGAGSFVAGLVLDRVGTLRPRHVLVAPLVIGGAPVLAGTTRSWAVTVGSFALVGAVIAWGGALVGSMRHASFPTAVQGRLALASRLGFSSGVLPGVLAAGWLAGRVGAASMYVIVGGIGLAGLLVGGLLRVDRLTSLTAG